MTGIQCNFWPIFGRSPFLVLQVASPEERALMADPLATLAPSSILAAAAGGPGAGSTQHSVLEPRGLLRVLVVDDQFTMRQMTAMLFQKFCLDYPNTKVPRLFPPIHRTLQVRSRCLTKVPMSRQPRGVRLLSPRDEYFFHNVGLARKVRF